MIVPYKITELYSKTFDPYEKDDNLKLLVRGKTDDFKKCIDYTSFYSNFVTK